jgi:hypothetical protein
MIYLYATLDTLFDTRLGILNNYLGDELFSSIDMNKYRARTSDNFHLVDIQTFSELYGRRNERALIKPRPTIMQEYIMTRILWYSQYDMINNGEHNGLVELVVNTEPYRLTGLQKDRLNQAITQILPLRSRVKLVTMDDSVFDKYEFKELFLYDGLNVVNRIMSKGEKYLDKLSSSIVVVPDNVGVFTTSDEERDKMLVDIKGMFEPFCQLEFCSVGFF